MSTTTSASLSASFSFCTALIKNRGIQVDLSIGNMSCTGDRDQLIGRQGGSSRVFLGMGWSSHLNNRNPYFMGPYKPLRTWVDEFIAYYMERMGV